MSAAPPANPSATVLNLQQAFKLALSMVLLYWLTLAMNWDMPKYGALAIVLISLDTSGASLRKGVMRVVGTTAGLAVGMLGVALFAQDIWLTLIFQAVVLVVAGYFMQTSRYPYAWFVAAFMPSLVWSSSYGKADYTFHFATFRYLETTAGVVIYSLVCTVFWPRRAGDELQPQGLEVCKGLVGLLRSCRRQLAGSGPAQDASASRGAMAGAMSRMHATLDSAYADTPAVRARRRAWNAYLVHARSVGDTLEMWRQCIADCKDLDVEQLLPEVTPSVQLLGDRLRRVEDLWQRPTSGEEAPDASECDVALLEPMPFEARSTRATGLSHLDQATLQSFLRQLHLVDLASRELLRTTCVLAGLAPIRDLGTGAPDADLLRPPVWDPARFVRALVPCVCFVVAYFFWLLFDPPTGPSIPNMAATLGLALMSAPVSAMVLIPVLVAPMWLLVAPVYLFVMPRLSSGLQLLAFIFCYVFVIASVFVGRLAPLKLATLVMFVMLTGISNQQGYSFVAVVDTSIMLVLAAGIVAVVQMLMTPRHSEQILLKNVRLFFRGCMRVTRGAGSVGPSERVGEERARTRTYASMIQPALGGVQAAQRGLKYDRYPGSSPDQVQRLIDGMQDIAHRLQALVIAQRGFDRHGTEGSEDVLPVVGEVRALLQSVFRTWSSLESGVALAPQTDKLSQLATDLERQFEAVEIRLEPSEKQAGMLEELHALVGGVRGLLDAVAGTQPVMREIDWKQLAAARF